MTDGRLIAYIRSVSSVTRRWNHLSDDQKRRVLMVMPTMEALSAEAVIKAIGKVRRAK